jgi:hypothetical protein
LSDELDLARYADSLADAVEAALPGWVERCVTRIMTASAGSVPAQVLEEAQLAGVCARSEIGARVRELLRADIDEQATTPLAILRSAVRYPTAVLSGAGVRAVERDAFSVSAFPDDVYDLTPSTWADISPDLVDAGIAWGAAKAFAHKGLHGTRG